MSHIRPLLSGALLVIGGVLFAAGQTAQGQSSVPAQSAAGKRNSAARELPIVVGKSVVIESPVIIQRVSIGDAQKAEAMVASPRELVITGKAPGDTTLLIWQQGGDRMIFDVKVRAGQSKQEVVIQELRRELPGQDVTIAVSDRDVFVRGTVKDMVSAERAISIASTLGTPVNLLRVKVPDADQQILLRVRFASVDRGASQELGANIVSLGATNTIGSIQSGPFTPPQLSTTGNNKPTVTFSDALNIFLFRPDLNIGATIRALVTKRLAEILAEPNLLAANGKTAKFIAGGEVPIPVIQTSGFGGAITVQYREFGIKLEFTPTVTPRGTIRLKIAPEVSGLDWANAVTVGGLKVPAIANRRVETQVELQDGQSFAVAGLLDNKAEEQIYKIPGLASIPLIGKIFQSKIMSKSSQELLVVVTPELVRPIPAGMPLPGPEMPLPWLKDAPTTAPRTPPISVTGPVPVNSVNESIPIEQLQAMQDKPAAAPPMQVIQMVPMPAQAPAGVAPAASSAPVTAK